MGVMAAVGYMAVYCWTPEKAGWRVSATVGL